MSQVPTIKIFSISSNSLENNLLESPPIKHLSPKTLKYNIKYLCYAPLTLPNKITKPIPKFSFE